MKKSSMDALESLDETDLAKVAGGVSKRVSAGARNRATPSRGGLTPGNRTIHIGPPGRSRVVVNPGPRGGA